MPSNSLTRYFSPPKSSSPKLCRLNHKDNRFFQANTVQVALRLGRNPWFQEKDYYHHFRPWNHLESRENFDFQLQPVARQCGTMSVLSLILFWRVLKLIKKGIFTIFEQLPCSRLFCNKSQGQYNHLVPVESDTKKFTQWIIMLIIIHLGACEIQRLNQALVTPAMNIKKSLLTIVQIRFLMLVFSENESKIK